MQSNSMEARPRTTVAKGKSCLSIDFLIREEPLDLLIGDPDYPENLRNLAMLMRTPGADEELARGFLFAEGILVEEHEILCAKMSFESPNRLIVFSKDGFDRAKSRSVSKFLTTSSCGLCASESSIQMPTYSHLKSDLSEPKIKIDDLLKLPAKMKQAQKLFKQSGGVHACALFDLNYELVGCFEDVGRHNALDKLIGSSLLQASTNLSQSMLLLSGRISYDLVQKASRAQIPFIAAIGAPTNLAVRVASEAGMTMVGFLGKESYNVYSGWERIQLSLSQESSAGTTLQS